MPTDVQTAVANRNSAVCLFVITGSSTPKGVGATTDAQQWWNIFAENVRVAYPQSNGHSPTFEDYASLVAYGTLPDGLHFLNEAISGTSSGSWLPTTETNRIIALQPKWIGIHVGSNDMQSGRPPMTYKANIEAKLATFRAGISGVRFVLIHGHNRGDVPTPAYAWEEYGAAMAAIGASASDVTFIDVSADFAALGVPTPDAGNLLGSDLVHLTDAGHAKMAELATAEEDLPEGSSTYAWVTKRSDTFNRADGALGTMDAGLGGTAAAWEGTGTAFAVVGNEGRITTNTAYVRGWTPTSADQSIRAKITVLPTGVSSFWNLRRTSFASSTARYALFFGSAGTFTVQRSGTTLTTQGGSGAAIALGDVVEFRVRNSGTDAIIEVLINDVLAYTRTDTAPVTITGIAAISAAAGQTAFGVDDVQFRQYEQVAAASGAASFSGSGSLAGSGVPRLPGVVVGLSGAGSLAVGAAPGVPRAVALSGSGSLAVARVAGAGGAGSLSGSGTLTAAATVGAVRSVALSGSGQLGAVGSAGASHYSASPSLSGSGSLTVARVPGMVRAAALSGAGTLSVSRVPGPVASVALTGAGSLSVGSKVGAVASVSLSGDGVLTVGAGVAASAVVGLSGSGQLTAVGSAGSATDYDFAVFSSAWQSFTPGPVSRSSFKVERVSL